MGRRAREGAYNCVIAVRLSRPDTMRTAGRLLPSFDIPDDRSRSPVRLRGQERPNICPRSVSLRWWSPLPADGGGGEAGGETGGLLFRHQRGAARFIGRIGSESGIPKFVRGAPLCTHDRRPSPSRMPPQGHLAPLPPPRPLGPQTGPLGRARFEREILALSEPYLSRDPLADPLPPPLLVRSRRGYPIESREPTPRAPRDGQPRQLTAANAFLHFSWRE